MRLPAGHQAVVSAAQARRMAADVAAVTGALREDSRRTRLAVWAALVDHLDPDTGLIVAGHAQLGVRASAAAGRRVPRSTVGNHVRALIDAGVLVLAQPGASRTALGSDRDRAPAYVIVVDAASNQDSVEELGHLPEGSAPTRTRVITTSRKTGNFSRNATPAPAETQLAALHAFLGRSGAVRRATPVRREHPERYPARTDLERRIAVAWLLARMGWAHNPFTEGEALKITGPFFRCGWSPAAVLRAWHRRPDDTAWPPLPEPHHRDRRDPIRVRNLWAVLTWRMAAWRDQLGHPLPAPIAAEQPPRGRPRTRSPLPTLQVAPNTPRPAGDVTQQLETLRGRLQAHADRRDAEQDRRRRTVQQLRDQLDQLQVWHEPADVHDVDQAAAGTSRSDLIQARARLRARVQRRRQQDAR